MLQLLKKFNCDNYDFSEHLWRNLLEVDFEAFLAVMKNKDDFIKEFNKVHVNFVIWLAEKIGVLKISNKSEVLSNIFEFHRDNDLVKLIVLLLFFFKEKRKEAFLESAKILVPDKLYKKIMNLEVSEHQKILLMGLFVYKEDIKKMVLWLHLTKSHTGGFTECTVIPDVDENEFEYIRVKKRIDLGLTLSLNEANEEDYNKLLQKVEQRRSKDEKYSAYICHEVVSDELYFYCLRTTRRVMIREIEETIWANDTELIILEFTDSFRKLRQRSTKGFGEDIASELISRFSGTSVKYIPASNVSGNEAVQDFINTLIEEKDKHFQLRELYVKQLNLEEAPSLIIRWNEKEQIGSAVRQLNSQFGLSIINIEQIEYIKVGFQTEEESDKKYHQFILYFNKYDENSVLVTYSTTMPLKLKREAFAKILKGYGINVVSKRRD